MKLGWGDVGEPFKGCQFPFEDGVLIITPRNIEIWKRYPDALFSVIRRSGASRNVTYGLGAWESRDADPDLPYTS